MVKKLTKLFLVLGVILFSSLIFSCKTKSFEVVEGKFVCNEKEFYGELELYRISEKEEIFNFLDSIKYQEEISNGLNVFKIDYGRGYQYYSVSLYVIFQDTEEKVYLDFKNLEVEEMRKITFKNYFWLDEDGRMLYPSKSNVLVTYKTDNFYVTGSFYQKDLGWRYANCVECNKLIDLNSDIVVVLPYNINGNMRSINGSYINSQGLIILVDKDIEAYIKGTLIFYKEDEDL